MFQLFKVAETCISIAINKKNLKNKQVLVIIHWSIFGCFKLRSLALAVSTLFLRWLFDFFFFTDDPRTNSEDALILKVIEAYCTSAKTRHTVNSCKYLLKFDGIRLLYILKKRFQVIVSFSVDFHPKSSELNLKSIATQF